MFLQHGQHLGPAEPLVPQGALGETGGGSLASTSPQAAETRLKRCHELKDTTNAIKSCSNEGQGQREVPWA